MTSPHIPELTPPKASNFLRVEKDVTLPLIHYEARFPFPYASKPHSLCEVRSGSLQTGAKGAVVLSYLLAPAPPLPIGTRLSVSKSKTTSSLLSTRLSPSALGQEELHRFHTAPPLTSAGTWKHAPSPVTFYIAEIPRHKALLRFWFRFLLTRVGSIVSGKGGGSHAPSCPASPHCPAVLPNALHLESPRSPLHLPVSTCRAPRATPTPLGEASPAAGSGEPLRGRARRGGGPASPTLLLLLREGWSTAEGAPAALQRQAGTTREELQPQVQAQAHGTPGWRASAAGTEVPHTHRTGRLG